MSDGLVSRFTVPMKDLKRKFFSERPRDVDGLNNTSAYYYRLWLLRKVFSIFVYEGMPDGWDLDYFNEHLFLDGVVCITDTDKDAKVNVGVVPLMTGVTGVNIYNHPTTCVIANPVLGSFRREIDVDCALVKLQYTYQGINEMLDRYSCLLAMCDSSIAVSLMNSKVTFMGECSSKKQAETMKVMYDQLSCGEPAVFYKASKDDEASNFYFNNAKQNFVAPDIQILRNNIVNDFLTEIGIKNANRDKKERLVTPEVDANQEEVESNIIHWMDNINEGFKVANKLYGLNLRCVKRNFDDESTDGVSGGYEGDETGVDTE